VDPLLTWLRASTQRQGAQVAQQGLSVLDQVVMDATPAPQVTLAITHRLQRFRLPLLPAPAAPPIPGPLPAGVEGASTVCSEMEADLIMASCGLEDDEWNKLPPLYQRMLEEGRTTKKTQKILQALT
jgi:hypothetical protein